MPPRRPYQSPAAGQALTQGGITIPADADWFPAWVVGQIAAGPPQQLLFQEVWKAGGQTVQKLGGRQNTPADPLEYLDGTTVTVPAQPPYPLALVRRGPGDAGTTWEAMEWPANVGPLPPPVPPVEVFGNPVTIPADNVVVGYPLFTLTTPGTYFVWATATGGGLTNFGGGPGGSSAGPTPGGAIAARLYDPAVGVLVPDAGLATTPYIDGPVFGGGIGITWYTIGGAATLEGLVVVGSTPVTVTFGAYRTPQTAPTAWYGSTAGVGTAGAIYLGP